MLINRENHFSTFVVQKPFLIDLSGLHFQKVVVILHSCYEPITDQIKIITKGKNFFFLIFETKT